MKNYFDFKNKNVLILGASSGFGRVYSKVMYGLGANVLSIARNFQRLKSLKKECDEGEAIDYFYISTFNF